MAFELVSSLSPMGDQPKAIKELVDGLQRDAKAQLLLGATGTGKTFTIAHVVNEVKKPTLVLAHNKTLAAQLYTEFRELFPRNAVEYFVSYYDYYQPEAYVPNTDTYIEKDALINDEIDRMRHSATRSILERDDVLVVASVSCIYGLGSAETYEGLTLNLKPSETTERDVVLRKLIDLQYERNDFAFTRGTFRVRGDVVEVFPVYEQERALRIEWFGDEIDGIREFDPLTGKVERELQKIRMFPASHYVTTAERRETAAKAIREELSARLTQFEKEGKLLEAQRLEQRTLYDLEMLETVGMVKGIENYSRHLSGRKAGEPPPTLLDYFEPGFLMVIDESHQSVPQLGAMYKGDRARKENLVDFGFRLPSALDNRPLQFREFEKVEKKLIFVSATPADYEIEQTEGVLVEQIIRPTGLLDPEIDVRPVEHQVDDLHREIEARAACNERVLVTTLTKRMAEDLTDYFLDRGVRVRYLHSDIDTLERAEILRDLRAGEFDVLVGINLLREGLDLPEVSLVAILDADKEGFLRGERSLLQTIGRAARNAHGQVIMYAQGLTESMQKAIEETSRRRALQEEYNRAHGITPRTIQKQIRDLRELAGFRTELTSGVDGEQLSPDELKKEIKKLRKEMFQAAEDLNFEQAAEFRDRIKALEEGQLGVLSKGKATRKKSRSAGRNRGRRSRP